MPFSSVSEIKKLQAARDIQGLIQALSYEHDVDIMVAAATALGEIGDESAINPLLNTLEGKVNKAQLTVMTQSMGLDLGDVEAKRALSDFIQIKSAFVHMAATQAIEKILHIDDTPCDLAHLDLLREGHTLEESYQESYKTAAKNFSYGSVTIYTDYREEVALKQPANSPWVGSMHGEAITVLRLEGLSSSEALHMRHAVTNNMVLLVPVLGRYPTFPVLGLRFIIYDNPADPLSIEGARNIVRAEVQNFLQALLHNGGGKFYLYAGTDAETIGNGTFLLRMPPFLDPGYPYTTQPADLRSFWLMLNLATKHLENIPLAARDFDTAVNYYLKHTSL